MAKTQVYLRAEELDALHRTARRSGRPVADLVREAVRRVWLRPPARGLVALGDGTPARTSIEHDAVYDERARRRGRATPAVQSSTGRNALPRAVL